MSKEAYYFSHDSNAHKDPKCIRLRRLAGMQAYGLFWCVIEMLRDAPENKIPLESRDDILFELRCEIKEWDALFESGLIVKDDEFFWSESLLRRMDRYHDIVGKKVIAGQKSAEKRRLLREDSTGVQQTLSTCSTGVQHDGSAVATESNKGKERKRKETKENIYPPEFCEFWSAYPRPVDKSRAFKAWKARIKEGADPASIIIAAKNYFADCQRNGTEQKYIKHPSTFLNPDWIEWANPRPERQETLELSL